MSWAVIVSKDYKISREDMMQAIHYNIPLHRIYVSFCIIVQAIWEKTLTFRMLVVKIFIQICMAMCKNL